MRVTNRRLRTFQIAVTHTVLIVAVIIAFLPIVWAISSSFKPLNDIFTFPIRWIPQQFTLDNYVEGLQAAAGLHP